MSNEPTIEQINLAIAEFMKLEKDHHAYLTEGRFRTEYLVNGYWLPLRKLKYHSSWDWLMPVVEKIEKMEWCVRIENWPKKFQTPYKELYSVWMWQDPEDCPEIQTYADSKIEATHKAVYQFITWYNQQPQTNE